LSWGHRVCVVRIGLQCFFFLLLPFPAQSTTCNCVSIVLLPILLTINLNVLKWFEFVVFRIAIFPVVVVVPFRVQNCKSIIFLLYLWYIVVVVRSICYRFSGGQVGMALTATPHERNVWRGSRLSNTGTSSSIQLCVPAETAAAAHSINCRTMSSLSLPRVLQNRKTSLDQVREHFEKIQVRYQKLRRILSGNLGLSYSRILPLWCEPQLLL